MTDHPRLADLHASETLGELMAVLAVDLDDLVRWQYDIDRERGDLTDPKISRLRHKTADTNK